MFRILLITNRASDNTGDQLIEECTLSLILTALKNFGVNDNDFKIISRDSTLGEDDRKNEIPNFDLLIFGGGPMISFDKDFHTRVSNLINYAEEKEKKVIFVGTGVERYDENNENCQLLKKALNTKCVKLISARDDYGDNLKKYIESGIPCTRVADSVCFVSKLIDIKPQKRKKKTIGIAIPYKDIFQKNGIDFNINKQFALYKDLIEGIKAKGFDYVIFNTGNYGDEVQQRRVQNYLSIPNSKCIYNMTRDKILKTIMSLDGLIAFRLHANIIGYSYSIPTVGLSWNPKVDGFYENIGKINNVIHCNNWNSQFILDKLFEVVEDKTKPKDKLLYALYESIFFGIKEALDKNIFSNQIWDIEQLLNNLITFQKLDKSFEAELIQRKYFRVCRYYCKKREFPKRQRLINRFCRGKKYRDKFGRFRYTRSPLEFLIVGSNERFMFRRIKKLAKIKELDEIF